MIQKCPLYTRKKTSLSIISIIINLLEIESLQCQQNKLLPTHIIIILNDDDDEIDNDIDYDFVPACSIFDFGTFALLAENTHNKADQNTDDVVYDNSMLMVSFLCS